jgi:DNA polymerase III alpha subunit (gram-positive type)
MLGKVIAFFVGTTIGVIAGIYISYFCNNCKLFTVIKECDKAEKYGVEQCKRCGVIYTFRSVFGLM